MFNSQKTTVCGVICDYCNTYYPSKRALTIHEYFHTSEDVDTLLSYSEISTTPYSLPKAKKSNYDSKRVTELFCNRTRLKCQSSNYRITKAFQISQDMEDMLYLTRKYPLKTNVKFANKRYSPYTTNSPNKTAKCLSKLNDFENGDDSIQGSINPLFNNSPNDSTLVLQNCSWNVKKQNLSDSEDRSFDDSDQDSLNSNESMYSKSDSAYDSSPSSNNMDIIEVRKCHSDSEIASTINTKEFLKLCAFNKGNFSDDIDLHKVKKLSSSFESLIPIINLN